MTTKTRPPKVYSRTAAKNKISGAVTPTDRIMYTSTFQSKTLATADRFERLLGVRSRVKGFDFIAECVGQLWDRMTERPPFPDAVASIVRRAVEENGITAEGSIAAGSRLNTIALAVVEDRAAQIVKKGGPDALEAVKAKLAAADDLTAAWLLFG